MGSSAKRGAALRVAGRVAVEDAPITQASSSLAPAPAPDASGAAAAASKDTDWRKLIADVYSIHAPERLSALDDLLKTYKGDEEGLYFRICDRYAFRPAVAKAKAPTASSCPMVSEGTAAQVASLHASVAEPKEMREPKTMSSSHALKLGVDAGSSRKAKERPSSDRDSSDPFNLRARFCQAAKREFQDALAEILNGEKTGHWSWYFFPVEPWVVHGKERGSAQNKQWCLRDKPPNDLRGEDAARAFLRFEADGVNLRKTYMTMMLAIAEQLENGIPPLTLVGDLDDPKLRSSLRLFERISRNGFDADVNRLCRRALRALCEERDP